MSRISDLISALNGEDYTSADKIYEDIKEHGTQRELQDADYIKSVL